MKSLVPPITVNAELDVTTPAGTLFFGLDLTAEEFTEGASPITVSYKLKPGTLPEPLKKILLEALEAEANGGGKDGYPMMSLRLKVNRG